VLRERVTADPAFRVLIRVPAHFLADEFAESLRAIGVPCGVWRGTEQPDPAAPGETMCRRLEDLKQTRMAGGSVSALCGSTKGGGICPFAGICGYKGQDLRGVNVVIVAGDVSLSNALPKKIRRPDVRVTVTDHETGAKKVKTVRPDLPDFNVVILDETTPTALVDGADTPDVVALAFLLQNFADLAALADHTPDIMAWETESIHFNLKMVHDLLTALYEQGYRDVSPATLIENDIDLETLKRVKTQLWSFRPTVGTDAGLARASGEKIAEALSEKSALLTCVRRCQRILSALIQGMEDAERHGTGEHHIATLRLRMRNGDQGRYLAAECITRSKLSDQITNSAILILDATPEPDLLRAWFPNLRVVGDFRAKDGRGVTRVQLVDSHMAYGAIVPKEGAGDHNRQRKNTFRAAMAAKVFGNLMGGAASLILPKGSKEHIETRLPELGETLRLGHFGGVRGSNLHNDSRVVVTAGRQAPAVQVAERLAEVINGKPVRRIDPDSHGRAIFGRAAAAILRRDGSGTGVVNERHPDPMVEAVRRSITEAELDQAQGRGRAVRRAEDSPLLDIRLSDVASDTPVDVIWTSQDLKAIGGFAGVLLATGVWPMGRGRGAFISAAYRKAAALWGCGPDQTEGLPDVGLLAGDMTGQQAGRTISGRAERNPALAKMIRAVDEAFQDGEDEADLLGVAVPLLGWHKATVTMSGEKQALSCSVMIQGETPDDAKGRASAIFEGCGVTVEGETPPSAEPTAAQRRFRDALDRYRFVPLSSREAARLMPDVWAGVGVVQRDLTSLGESDSLPRDFDTGSLYRVIYGKHDQTSCCGESLSQNPVFLVRYRAEPCGDVRRPRLIDAVVQAGSDVEARAVIEAVRGPLAEFEVMAAPETAEPDPDHRRVRLSPRVTSALRSLRLTVQVDLPNIPPVPVPVSAPALLRSVGLPANLKIPEPPPRVRRLYEQTTRAGERHRDLLRKFANLAPQNLPEFGPS
jgi:hypothetical protein